MVLSVNVCNAVGIWEVLLEGWLGGDVMAEDFTKYFGGQIDQANSILRLCCSRSVCCLWYQ